MSKASWRINRRTCLQGTGVALALPVLWDRALAYFSTVYENSLLELAIFITLACSMYSSVSPLVVGRVLAKGQSAVSASVSTT